MCGISAVIALSSGPIESQRYRKQVSCDIEKSLGKIQHRGPNNTGYWISQDNRVALGHVRLSIKDLSTAASQPLPNEESNIHAVVNGEFYGYERLYAELAEEKSGSYKFQSGSDSELLIALYERDGINCFSYLRGEFSFVLYDSQKQLILAATDRFGIKPLFWTVLNKEGADYLLIASEAKAFLPLGWKPEWDVRSIVEDGWLHDERTLFRGIRKVMPGHYMMCYSFEFMNHRPYWEIEFPDKNMKEPRSDQQMVSELRSKLYESVSLRVQGDVPVGVYLSGGLDSAIIAGILADVVKAQGGNDSSGKTTASLKCFSVGFDKDTEFDEMPIAQRTAEHLGAEFIAQRLNEKDLAENFEATTVNCEHHNPDLNSVGKFLLSKLVADHGIKVVLSGEGADEHFGGYSQLAPDAIREPDLAAEHNRMSSSKRQELTRRIEARTTPGYKGVPSNFDSSQSSLARRMLNDCSISACLWAVTNAPFASWTKQYGPMSVQETRAHNAGGISLDRINNMWHPLHTAQYIWTRSILPNLILTSMGDRMEMAHSIEGRTPFLDHHLTHFANFLPPSVKVKVDAHSELCTEKWILREAGKPFISKEMYERKKHPFTAPHRYDVGGPMHDLLSRLVTRENIEQLGFVDVGEGSVIVEKAFSDRDDAAMRAAIILGQWIVLSREFCIPRATPPGTAPERSWAIPFTNHVPHEMFKEWVRLRPTFAKAMRYVIGQIRLMY